MPRMRSLVPTILAVLVAATGAADRAASAGDDCLAGPNADAPQDRHWYYRLDHAAHRKCWYLGPQGAKVRRVARTAPHATARPAAPVAAPPASAQPVAPPSSETTAVAAPPPPAASEIVPNAADSAAIGSGLDDTQGATRLPDRIAARPVPTAAERARPEPVQSDPAPAEPAGQAAPIVDGRAALMGAALLLAFVGAILVRAGRRASRSLDELAAPAFIGIDRRRREVPAQAGTDVDDPHSAALMRAKFAADIAQATLQPDLDPLPTAAIDAPPDVEQSLRQVLRAWERLALSPHLQDAVGYSRQH
jgi:hypothetical protein